MMVEMTLGAEEWTEPRYRSADGGSGLRERAAEIIMEARRRRAYVDVLLNACLEETHLSPRDRSLLADIVRGTVRWQRYLRWVVKRSYRGDYGRAPALVRAALEAAAYQLFFLERVPEYAIVSQAVEIVRCHVERPWDARVNAILRTLAPKRRNRPLPTGPEPVRRLGIAYSHPDWMVARWVNRLGLLETEALLRANNEPPSVSLRINYSKTSVEMIERELTGVDASMKRVEDLPGFVLVRGLRRSLSEFEMFAKGYVFAQDPRAILPVLLLDPRPGECLWDTCAAPGGKTTALAERLNGEGRVIALDRHLGRIYLVSDNAARLGLSNVETVVADAALPPFKSAQKILVDAPCSGTGVLRRRVDLRWQRSQAQIPQLAQLQRQMLEAVSGCLPAGGVLVYSTCTLELEENDAVVESFLSKHPEFRLERAQNYVPHRFCDNSGYVRTFPHRHGTDGTFAARLVRRE